MQYDKFLEIVLTKASGLATSYFGHVSSVIKEGDNNQILTEADTSVGSYIVNVCLEEYPTYNVIDEEAGIVDKNGQYTWVIDPVDGTSNFAAGLPLYGIYIGLLYEDIPIAGGLALPAFNKIYIAEKEKGCFCNGEKMSVSQEEKLSNSLVAYQIDGHPESPEITEKEIEIFKRVLLAIRNERTTNSAYDFAMVLEGRYGAILNQTSKIWDNVAQQILMEEAGGRYTDLNGNKIDYSQPLAKAKTNFSYCGGGQSLHQQLLALLQEN